MPADPEGPVVWGVRRHAGEKPAVDVRLRPYQSDDAAAIHEAVHESLTELQPWVPWSHPAYAVDEAANWLRQQVSAFAQGTAYEFAILSAGGRYLGGCGLNQIDAANHRANLGYWVRTAAARQGVATAAVRRLRDWGFTHTSLVRMEIVVAVGNLASARVAAKAGATYEGVLSRRLYLRGVYHDAAMFSFTKGS